MRLLDGANKNLYESARERDRVLWIVDAQRAWRDALLQGRDDTKALSTLVLRLAMVRRGREADRAAARLETSQDGK